MSFNNKIYLDYNATTPIDPQVLQAMLPIYSENFGNPASEHCFGKAAVELVDAARQQIARFINASQREIIFTSGATESCNLAIKGVAKAYYSKGKHIIVSTVEHKAVLEPCKRLATEGYELTILQPDSNGQISAEQVADAINRNTILVCVMMANNVVGTINPVEQIGQLCRKRGVVFFCDATQAAGKMPIDVEQMNIDLLAMSAHKIYGTKGIGCLYVKQKKPRVKLVCQNDGGGQEYGYRSGTLNVPGIVGFGAACEMSERSLTDEAAKIKKLRDKFEKELLANIPDIIINSAKAPRLPNTSNILFKGIEAAVLLKNIPDIAASSGSACDAGGADASYVLTAMGISNELAKTSIRFSLGRFTTEQEINTAVQQIKNVVLGL